MKKKGEGEMKHIKYLFIVLFIFILTSCFVRNNKPRAEIQIGIFESESFKPNEKNYLYGRTEIKEITDVEYENANGINVGKEDRSNRRFHFNLGFYNGETNEFEYYDIKDFKLKHLYNRAYWYSAILFSESNSDVSPEVIWVNFLGNDILSIDLTFGDMDFGGYYIPIDKIKFNDSIPLGKFRSNDFKEDNWYPDQLYSYCIVEIKEISEEEYNEANGINVVADISGRQGIRKYCLILVSFYDHIQEKWIECELKDCTYNIRKERYMGLLYQKGTTTIIIGFDLQVTKDEAYDFTLLLGIDAYFTRIEENNTI